MKQILSREIVTALKADIAARAEKLRERGVTPRIAAFIATDDDAARSYLASKQKVAQNMGIVIDAVDLSSFDSLVGAKDKILEIVGDKEIHGAIVELPVKPDWDEVELINAIPENKDIDGLSIGSLGALMQGKPSNSVYPATPQACIRLAETFGKLDGKSVVVVGRGRTVGKPLANMLIAAGATVTCCNSKTKNLEQITQNAEIVFLATGRGLTFGSEFFRNGQIIIDAGISIVDNKIVGDVALASLEGLDVSVTPVPGGVGPLTSAIVFENLLKLIGGMQ